MSRQHHPGTRSTAVVAVLAASGVLAALMQTIVVPIVADLPRLLHTAPSNTSWVITATLLTAAITTPISGRLGDMYGKRRILVGCIAVMVLGSLLCAATSSLPVVITGRAMQGFATCVIPLGISILRDELPSDRIPGAIALVSATLGVGASVGLPVSAFAAQHVDWHFLFLGAAAAGSVSLGFVLAFVPESPVRSPGRFDVVGAVGLAAGLSALLLAVTKGTAWGWGSPTTLGLIGAAVVVLALWTWHEGRVGEPVVDLRISTTRPVLLTNGASLLTGFALYAQMLVLPQLLQAPPGTGYGLGQSLLMSGLCMAPSGFVMMLLSPVAGRVSRAYGPRTTLVSGLAVVAAGYLGANFLMSAAWQLAVVSAVIGAGIGLAYSAMPALIMGAVPVHETGAANGLNALMRSTGTALSSAVVALILTSHTLAGTTVPTRGAFHAAFLLAAVAALTGLALAWFIPRRRAVAPSPVPHAPHVPQQTAAPRPAVLATEVH